MVPTQPPPSGSWSPSKKAAITLGIILGLVLLILSVMILCKLLKKHVTRWIKDELMYNRYKHGDYCMCEQSHGDEAYPRSRLPSNSIISGHPPSSPPSVLQGRFPPSRPLREPHYHPRQDGLATPCHSSHERVDSPYRAGDNQTGNSYRTRYPSSVVADYPEPGSLERGGEIGFSWEAGNERIDYTPPYATSAPASAVDQSPHGTTSRARRAADRDSK